MTGCLYLHIGPPKTATTAFQYALQEGIPGRLIYGGVKQPRSFNNLELSCRLHSLCAIPAKMPLSDMQAVQENIAATLSNGSNLLISEEMFLVDSGSVQFQEKIARLGRISGVFHPNIILCARNPLEGLPSLYQELYRKLPVAQKLSFKRFVQSNQAYVFNYPFLLEILNQNGFQNVMVIDFNQLVNGELSYSDIFGAWLNSEQKLEVPKTNSGVFHGAKKQRVFEPFKLRDVLGFRQMVSEHLRKSLRESPWAGKCWEMLAELRLSKSRVQRLNLPNAMARELVAGYEKVLLRNNLTLRN